MIHEQLPLPVPCYDFVPLIESTLGPFAWNFGYPQLAWRDGRWVQDPGTYSPQHGWSAVTSDSGFMRSGFRPQSELGDCLIGFAPDYSFASRCQSHCITCAAQDIKGPCWFGVILTFLLVVPGSPLWHMKHRARVAQVTPFKGATQATCWRQPCSTWVNVLVGRQIFRNAFINLSSPGKVPRLLSN